MAFLRAHAPFSSMEDDHLALFAEHASLRFYADNDVILSPGNGAITSFHVVKQGQVRGERDNKNTGETENTFEISVGECFPLAALIGERPTRTLHRAVGDTFCLILKHDVFVSLFAESATFRDFCLRGVSSLLDQVNRRIQSDAMKSIGSGHSLDMPLRHYALRNPIVCSPDVPIRKAVARMHESNVGSVVITDEQQHPIGIFTLRHLHATIADQTTPLDAPVQQAMTPNPVCLPDHADGFDAALLMAEHHFSHICVTNDNNELVGVISERDLFSLQRVDLVHLARTIGTAPCLHTLVSMRTEVSRLVDSMLAHGADSDQIVKIITTLNDVTVRRVLELNRQESDPGIEFTWLTFGSEGRQEQTLLTEQNNGILFEVPEDMTAEEVRKRLLPFAEKVNNELADCGFTLCTGNIMASNPKLCLSVNEWGEWFVRFIDASTPPDLVYSSIFLDLRAIYGPRLPSMKLLDQVHKRIQGNLLFQKRLAKNALNRRPPLTMFRGFRYSHDGEKNTIDLKRQGLSPFVESIRVFALANGIKTANTLERINLLEAGGVFDRKDANAWKDSYSLIQAIRMRAHQEQSDQGQPLSNYINLDDLNSLDQRILRESFRQAQRLQQKLEVTYQL